MRTVVWWAVWGLVVSAGLVGLLDAGRDHAHLLLAIPLLSGAAAAAILRVKYEYHHAVQHAKWLALSSLFLMTGMGYLYAKANAFGPFATGTTSKAFLGTTFEMSVPEVERTLGRRLTQNTDEKPLSERAQEWIVDALPLPGRPTEERFELPLSLYHVPSRVSFLFRKARLGGVRIEFEPVSSRNLDGLLTQIRSELEKDYKPATPNVFQKQDVRAVVDVQAAGPNLARAVVSLQYLPFTDAETPPLAVESNAF